MVKNILLLAFMIGFTYATAHCEFEVISSQSVLSPTGFKNGFATRLTTVEPQKVLITCTEGNTAIRISKPIRLEDGGPVLKGPTKSYITYKEKTFSDKQQLILTGSIEPTMVDIGITLANDNAILPASENYAYQVILRATDLTHGDESTYSLINILNESAYTEERK